MRKGSDRFVYSIATQHEEAIVIFKSRESAVEYIALKGIDEYEAVQVVFTRKEQA